jgi:hypothetical protein
MPHRRKKKKLQGFKNHETLSYLKVDTHFMQYNNLIASLSLSLSVSLSLSLSMCVCVCISVSLSLLSPFLPPRQQIQWVDAGQAIYHSSAEALSKEGRK